jgi:hypothetical protein
MDNKLVRALDLIANQWAVERQWGSSPLLSALSKQTMILGQVAGAP